MAKCQLAKSQKKPPAKPIYENDSWSCLKLINGSYVCCSVNRHTHKPKSQYTSNCQWSSTLGGQVLLSSFFFFFIIAIIFLIRKKKTTIIEIERVVISILCFYISALVGAEISEIKMNFTSLLDIFALVRKYKNLVWKYPHP